MKKRTSRILAIAMVLAMLAGMIPAAFASSGKVLFEAEQANTNGVNPDVVTGSQFVVETTLNITSISDTGMKFVLGNNASGQPVEVWLGEYAVITVNSAWGSRQWLGISNITNRDLPVRLVVNGSKISLFLDNKLTLEATDSTYEVVSDSKVQLTQWTAAYTVKNLTIRTLDTSVLYKLSAPAADGVQPGVTTGDKYVAEGVINIGDIPDKGDGYSRHIKFILGTCATDTTKSVTLYMARNAIWCETTEWKGYGMYPFNFEDYRNRDVAFKLIVDGTYVALYLDGKVVWAMKDASFQLTADSKFTLGTWDATYTIKSMTVSAISAPAYGETIYDYDATSAPTMTQGAGTRFVAEATANISSIAADGGRGVKFILGQNAAGNNVEVWIGKDNIWANTDSWKGYNRYPFDITPYLNQDTVFTLVVDGTYYVLYANGEVIWELVDSSFLLAGNTVVSFGDWDAPHTLKDLTVKTLEEDVILDSTAQAANGFASNTNTGAYFVVDTTLNISAMSDVGMKFELGTIAGGTSGQRVELWLSQPSSVVRLTSNNEWIKNVDFDWTSYMGQDIAVKVKVEGKTITAYINGVEVISATDDRLLIDDASSCVLGGWSATYTVKGVKYTKLEAPTPEPGPGEGGGEEPSTFVKGGAVVWDAEGLNTTNILSSTADDSQNNSSSRPANIVAKGVAGKGFNGTAAVGYGITTTTDHWANNFRLHWYAAGFKGEPGNDWTSVYSNTEMLWVWIDTSEFDNAQSLRVRIEGKDGTGSKYYFWDGENQPVLGGTISDPNSAPYYSRMPLTADYKGWIGIELDTYIAKGLDLTKVWNVEFYYEPNSEASATDTKLLYVDELWLTAKYEMPNVSIQEPGPGEGGGEEPGPGEGGGEEPGPGTGGEEPGPGEGGEETDPNLLYELAAPTTGSVTPNVVTGPFYSVEAVINASNFTYNYANVKFHVGYNAAGQELRFELNEDSVYANLCTPTQNGEDQMMLNQDNVNFGLGENLNQDVKIKLVVEGDKWTFYVGDTQSWTITDERLIPTDTSMFKFSAWEVTYNLKSLKVVKLAPPAPGPGEGGGEEPGPGTGGEEPGPGTGGEQPGPGTGGEEPGPGTGGEQPGPGEGGDENDSLQFGKGGLVLWNAEAADLNNVLSTTPDDGGEVNSSKFPANLIAKGVNGKGYDGSRALAYGMKAMPNDQYWGNHLRLHWKGAGFSYDWSNSEMLWFWVDSSEFSSAQSIRVQIEGKKGDGSKYYLWDGENELVLGGTIASGDPTWGRMPMPAGFVGWVGIELDGYIANGLDLAKVWNVEFYFEPWNEASETDTKLLYIDELWLTKKQQLPDLSAAEEETNKDPDVLYELKVPVNNMLNPNVVTGNKFVAEMTLNISSMSDLGVKIILGKNADGVQNELWLSGTRNDIFISNPDWKGSGLDSTKFDFASLKGKDIDVKVTVDGEKVTVEIDGKLAWQWEDPSFRLAANSMFKMEQWTANYAIKSLKLSKLTGSVVNPETADHFSAWVPAVVALFGVAGAAFVVSQKKRFF